LEGFQESSLEVPDLLHCFGDLNLQLLLGEFPNLVTWEDVPENGHQREQCELRDLQLSNR
jgi:hypothetical protein